MRSKGILTEQFAADYLINQNLRLIDKNFSSKRGEIDLIMQEHNTLVFIEVKYRKKIYYGRAYEAVSLSKQKKIKLCAAFYLQLHGFNAYNTDYRFDILSLEGELYQPQVTWLKNAF